MQYPVSSVLTYNINIGKHVFNRTYDKLGNLVKAKFIVFYFTILLNSRKRQIQATEFEKIVKKFVF